MKRLECIILHGFWEPVITLVTGPFMAAQLQPQFES